jgi:lipid II:glycine glycyltransferase (peptidoglycan interpeptide bridge formation enzyme)
MPQRKLKSSEQLYLSQLIDELKTANQLAISKGLKAYSYSWQKLTRQIQDAVGLYEYLLDNRTKEDLTNTPTPVTK